MCYASVPQPEDSLWSVWKVCYFTIEMIYPLPLAKRSTPDNARYWALDPDDVNAGYITASKEFPCGTCLEVGDAGTRIIIYTRHR